MRGGNLKAGWKTCISELKNEITDWKENMEGNEGRGRKHEGRKKKDERKKIEGGKANIGFLNQKAKH